MSAESLQDRLWNEWSCQIRSAEPYGLRSCHSWHHYIHEHFTAVTAATRRSNGLNDLWPPIPRFPAAVASLWFNSSSSTSKLLTLEKRYLSRGFSLGRGFLTVLCVSLTVFVLFFVFMIWFFDWQTFYFYLSRWCHQWRASWGKTLLHILCLTDKLAQAMSIWHIVHVLFSVFCVKRCQRFMVLYDCTSVSLIISTGQQYHSPQGSRIDLTVIPNS